MYTRRPAREQPASPAEGVGSEGKRRAVTAADPLGIGGGYLDSYLTRTIRPDASKPSSVLSRNR